MPSFETLWQNHPGRAFVCDATVFENQCAMRMGVAIDKSGIQIGRDGLRTCVGYDRRTFHTHAPGHILAAQQLADVLAQRPQLLGTGTHCKKHKGSIFTNLASFAKKKGVVFILNGWGRTDHIDLFNGESLLLKGGDSTYLTRGEQVWFWEMA